MPNRRIILVGLASSAAVAGLASCTSMVASDCDSASSDFQRTACKRERAQIVGVTVGMIIGASLGYVVGRQLGVDPRVAALVGAAAGGVSGSLIADYANFLLERSDGRALGASQLLNTNLGEDIVYQENAAAGLRTQFQTFRTAAERPRSVIDSAGDIAAERPKLREQIKKVELYHRAPAIYKGSLDVVIDKGTKTASDAVPLKQVADEISSSNRVLVDKIRQTDEELQANLAYLTRIGVPI